MAKGYLVGAFDLFNVRHLDVIAQLRRDHDEVLVGVLADTEVEAANGRPPVVPLHERVRILSHVRGVSRVDVHGMMTEAEGVTWFAISGERLPDGMVVTWVDPHRDTVSTAVRDATAPAPSVLVA